MAEVQLAPVLRHIRRLVGGPAEPSDGQLLERFVASRDEAAFRGLLDRHGPMVLGVCRRLLRNEHDAEDAFQATFLVLARKAGSIRRGEALAGWLYEVAGHTASKARAREARRRDHERRVEAMPYDDPWTAAAWRDLRPMLDAEVRGLPAKYRLPVILCYMEGKTNEQAARELGWTKGTVSGRLARARQMLQTRLSRRGVGLGSGLVMGTVAREAAAAVPAGLAQTTLEASVWFAAGNAAAAGALAAPAVALAEGVLKAMAGIKLTVTTVVLLALGLLGTGAGSLVHQVLAADPLGDLPAKSGPRTADAHGEDPQQAEAAAPGDLLPAGAVLRLGSNRLAHGHLAFGVAFAPDGKTLVSAGHDHMARLWDTGTGKPLRLLGEMTERTNPYALSRWIHTVAFSPDGKTLATAEHATGWRAGTIRLFETATGKKLLEIKGHQQGVLSLAFSPDGKTLASASADGTVRLWEAATGKELVQIAAAQAPIHTVAFTADGKQVVARGDDRSVRFWETANGQEVQPAGGALTEVDSLAVAPDGKTLALGGEQGKLRLLDPATGKETRQLAGHTDTVRCLAFSADGKHLVSSGDDKTMRVWEVATGKEARAFAGMPMTPQHVAVSAGGRWVASTSQRESWVRLWDVVAGKEAQPQAGPRGVVRPVSVAANGKFLSSAAGDRTLRRWDLTTGKELRQVQAGHSSDHGVTFSDDGKLAAWAGWDGGIRVLDWETGRELRVLKGHDQTVHGLVFAADGKQLASSSADGTIRIWETATGKELRQFAINAPGPVWFLLFAPDAKKLAWACNDATVQLIDATTGNELNQFLVLSGKIHSTAFSPDGHFLAAGTTDGKVTIWDAVTGRLIREHEKHPGYVLALAFSADSRTLAAGSWRTIRLWELSTGNERARFEDAEGDVMALAFAPDGRSLVSGAGDSTMLLWDLTDRKAKRPAAPLAQADLDRLWGELTGDDAVKAYRALFALAAAPAQALPLARKVLKPVAKADAKRIDQWMADLNSDTFAVREKATQELEKLGKLAEPALRKALANQPSAEVKRRIENMLSKIETGSASAERARTVRLVELLEQVRTPEARKFLEELAKGDPAGDLTVEAKRSLARLERR